MQQAIVDFHKVNLGTCAQTGAKLDMVGRIYGFSPELDALGVVEANAANGESKIFFVDLRGEEVTTHTSELTRIWSSAIVANALTLPKQRFNN